MPSYGEVWAPDGVPRDWRPYEYGHWVYTDDWGWYWVSDDVEDDWGWVVYHYGRWIHDRGAWFWVPGDEWAPAWVDWRYGGDDIGWAPLPPDDMVDAYDDEPSIGCFVPLRYIGEPELRRHYVPLERRAAMLRETRIINRPVHIEGRRVWVNPGLAPGFIAGRTHVALHAYNVRPRVFGATTGVQGAVTVRRDELHNKGDIRRVAPVTIQRTTTAIAPTVNVPPPKPLGKGEHGELGSHPPRAAQGAVTPSSRSQPQARRRAAAERSGDDPAERPGPRGHADHAAGAAESADAGTARGASRRDSAAGRWCAAAAAECRSPGRADATASAPAGAATGRACSTAARCACTSTAAGRSRAAAAPCARARRRSFMHRRRRLRTHRRLPRRTRHRRRPAAAKGPPPKPGEKPPEQPK